MKKFILAKKVGMTQLFEGDGAPVAVTVLEVSPNVVTGVRSKDKEGYEAVQVGMDEVLKEKRLTKPLRGHLTKKDLPLLKHLREFRTDEVLTVGDILRVEIFEPGEKVKIRARSIGKGFQGVVKRHGFKGGPASHGHRNVLRRPGSIGGRFPQRTLKGKRMAGRDGGHAVSVKNIVVARVDTQHNLLMVRGAVPGKVGALVEVTGE
jgi:large subunit ribosomal protein L3